MTQQSETTPVATTSTRRSAGGARQATVRRSRAIAVLSAGAAGLLGWVAADALLGVDLAVQTGDTATLREVGPVAALLAGLMSGLAGWLLLAVLERFTARARSLWRAIALLTLVVSLVGTLDAVTTAATAALATLHVLVGATVLVLLPRRASR
jgi:hypothetical protein